MAISSQDISEELQEHITKILQPKKVEFMKRVKSTVKCKSEEKILACTAWRAFLLPNRIPTKVESSFSYLEINAIDAADHSQVVIETEKSSYTLKLMSFEDLEQVVTHVTASLKKIFPDSSPRKLLKKNSPELHERIKGITLAMEEETGSNLGPCGGYSEMYAALCDYNGFLFKEEIQWDVNTIYHSQNTKEFNLLDFSHLDSRDISLSVAALAFNQWFTKLFSKDLRLSPDVIEQILYVISLSTKLEELVLENAGIKFDTAQKIAQALEENVNPALHTINLSNNQLEDKGVSALSQQFEKLAKGLKSINFSRTSLAAKGLNSLAQALVANEAFTSSLVHLDLSGNPGILAVEDNCSFYAFLARPNALVHLDLAGTDCALDALFGALNQGCCTYLTSLILNRNVISHRKAKEIPSSMKQFFSTCLSLKCIMLSGIKLPLEAVRAILQGLAYNTHIHDVHLDLSNCELRSAGAQVIQDHIIDASVISSLDLSDNGFDSDMVTLVLSIGRSKSIRHVALGKNFSIKSKALADVLHRIVQLIQDEECPLQSLSVADSRLKSGANVLINALGSNTCLKKVDISGNAMGDIGAKMLAKALQINTTLETVIWDRNNTTAVGFLDVARALERNYTLRSMPLPMSDVSQSCRNNPEKTEEAVQKVQSYLLRNNQMKKVSPEQAFRLQERIVTSSTQQMVHGMCEKVQEYLHIINNGSEKEKQEDIIFAEEIIKDAKTLTTLLPALYQMGNTPPCIKTVQGKLESAAEEVSKAVTEEIEDFHMLVDRAPKSERNPGQQMELVFQTISTPMPVNDEPTRYSRSQEYNTIIQSLLKSTGILCPTLLQKVNMQEQLINNVSDKIFNPKSFARSMIIDQTGLGIMNKLSEVKLHVTTALISQIVDHVLKDLAIAQQKLACYATKPLCETDTNITSVETLEEEAISNKTNVSLNIPDVLAPIESLSLLRRKTIHANKNRPTTLLKSISDIEVEKLAEEEPAATPAELLTVGVRSAKSRPASTETSAVNGTSTENAGTDSLADLPTQGMRLQHRTRERPRPNRTRRQPPSKPSVKSKDQEKGENTTKLDDGLEEFFRNKTVCEETSEHHQEAKTHSLAKLTHSSADQTVLSKSQPAKQEETSTSTSILSKTKKRCTKFSDLFVFKKGKVNKMQKAGSDPEETQQKGKKGSSLDFLKLHCKSDEVPGQAKPQEGSAEQNEDEDVRRREPPSRGVKAHSLILLPGNSSNLSVHPLEFNSDLSEGKLLFRSEEHIHQALGAADLKTIPSDPQVNLSIKSELELTKFKGVAGDNKPEPPPQSLKRVVQANIAKSCASQKADKEGNFEGQLSSEAKNAELGGEETTQKQEITSGRNQKILLPPPRTKLLQKRNTEQNVNPVPLPRKLIASQSSLTLNEARNLEICVTSKSGDKNESHTAEQLSQRSTDAEEISHNF